MAGKKAGEPLAPEIRVTKIDSSGGIAFKFTVPLDLPAGTEARLLSDSEDAKEASLFEAFAVYAESTDESEANTLPIMDSWTLVSLNSTNLELKLNYSEPLKVSAGDKPDLMMVQVDLSRYKDINGQTPVAGIKIVEIPRQMASEAEA